MSDPIPAAKAAEWFLSQGFKAFPVWGVTDTGACRCPKGAGCDQKGKHPASVHGFLDATDDIAKVRTFLQNPGTPNYGLVAPVDVVAVDVDGEGKQRWDELQHQYGPLPATLTVVTANGYHYFYRVPADLIGKRLFGFVTRSQKAKGYTLGPGSLHASGVTYGLLNGKGGIQPLPDRWVAEGFPKQRLASVSSITVGGPPDPSSITEGSRHDYLRDRARTLRGGGLTGEALLNAVMALNAQLPSPKTQEEVERAIGDVETKFPADPLRLLPSPEQVEEEAEERLEDFPTVIDAISAVAPKDIDDWMVVDLIRPRQLVVLASTEGVGKSNMRLELGIRYACGHGALFDTYPMGRAGDVLLFDEENGEREEFVREEAMLASLDLKRDPHMALYHRVHYSGLNLESLVDQSVFDKLLTLYAPQLVILDTAGAMVGEEHGKDFKRVIAFLKAMKEKHDCAIVLVVHLVKPPRDGKTVGKALERTITDVMGQWTRSADVLLLVSETDDDDVVLFRVRKRVTRSDLSLKRETPDAPDRWARVDAKRLPATVVAREEHATILGAIAAGRTTWEQVTGYLAANELPVPSRATMFRHLKQMDEAGLIVRDEFGVIVLTDLGRSAVPPRVSLVLGEPPVSVSPNPPTGGGETDETGSETGVRLD
jgi:hypothetical protein